jgi:uncharacterized protein YndB with AHSA1/START domain
MPDDRTLTLDRVLAAPRAKVWRCWSEPKLIEHWFCPQPWRCARAEIELRPGGRFRTVMNGPNGEVVDSTGVVLDVAPGARLVFTDAYVEAWDPSPKPFMTAMVTLADAPGGTRYIARAAHWSAADRKAHEEMGFQEGWGRAADQLERLAASL